MAWFSGLLPLENPHKRSYISPGHYKFLEVRQGNFLRARNFNYAELEAFKTEQFGYFQMTDDYREIAHWWRLKHPDMREEQIAEIIRDRILHYTTEVFVD